MRIGVWRHHLGLRLRGPHLPGHAATVISGRMKLRAALPVTAAVVLAVCMTGEPAPGTKKGPVINLDEVPPASTSTPAKRPAATSTSGPAVRKVAPVAPAPAKVQEEERKVDGFEISRGERGFLGIKIENNQFRVTFYDAEKKPVPSDVAAIALRWPVKYQPNPERVVLMPSGEGLVMTSEKVIRAPFSFRLYVMLLKDVTPGADTDPETYVVDFQQ